MRARSGAWPGLLLVVPCLAGAADLSGTWQGPLGTVEVHKTTTGYTGTLKGKAAGCAGLEPGAEVLRGDFQDGTFLGELRLCLEGPECKVKESFLNALLVSDPKVGRLSGAVEVGGAACHAVAGKGGGVALRRGAAPAPAAPAPAKPAARADPREAEARALLKDGAAYLDEGRFEKARGQFEKAAALVPLPEAYNGIGVTYYARREFDEALLAYRQALDVQPGFGDAYYNIGCIYALQGKPELALKHLALALRNGYKTTDELDKDPDLASLRTDPRYQQLVHPTPAQTP
jgi:hypothetical protein